MCTVLGEEYGLRFSEWAMLVPACIALFIDSCDFLCKLYMDSQGQEGAFNMEACLACDKNRLTHMETEPEKRYKHKKQPHPIAVL
jgi:hypothetical protein